ncbi:MAG: CehA/McbA family metallohydrolase [FCB group bacterium]|nr:CehA/McbA family metallohydrolase [FCB group bacterium]MBL7028057.1 CehA/McbA family metallohydrolase [Candidatus Neomarinimicrobiota bacterium]MBL7122795.1 CehA/McbA family metallohydrolase [Candidatus Neomarinimicrobiota bacterium]
MISDKLLDMVPLIGLYAETHFRFRIPFSRYFKREPELIFDTPWRLEPGQKPSIFLVVKDAHLYPIKLESVEIVVSQNNQKLCTQNWTLNQDSSDRQIDFEFSLVDCELPRGEVEILPTLTYSISGKQRRMRVDNYHGTRKTPLRVIIAKEGLPKLAGWQTGDTHLHSSLTNDQIEFGASLEQTRKAAQLLGLDFITATDHSYDLDDQPDDYLKNDPELEKWKQSRAQIAALNKENILTIIPGEEISVANHRGATVHFLHFNDPVYFPGSGDSGEDWPKLKSQMSIDDVLARRSPQTVSVGAHTAYKFPWFQRVLLKRGFWEGEDHNNPELDGVQILCGTPAYTAFHSSRQLWIDALLKGFKLGAYGGSDGHGNLNRNWHVTLPMWSLGTHEDQIFAQSRTIVRSDTTDTSEIVEAMKQRRTALSTGPMGDLTITFEGTTFGIGDTLKARKNDMLKLNYRGYSTEEFGSLMEVTIYAGNLDTQEEMLLFHDSELSERFEITQNFTVPGKSYLRLEISSEGSRWPGIYVSSPIWVEASEI